MFERFINRIKNSNKFVVQLIKAVSVERREKREQ